MATASKNIELNQVSVDIGLPIAYSCYKVIKDKTRSNKNPSTQIYTNISVQYTTTIANYNLILPFIFLHIVPLRQHRPDISLASSSNLNNKQDSHENY